MEQILLTDDISPDEKDRTSSSQDSVFRDLCAQVEREAKDERDAAEFEVLSNSRHGYEFEYKQTHRQWLTLRTPNKYTWHRSYGKGYEAPLPAAVPVRGRSKSCPPKWEPQSHDEADAAFKKFAKRNPLRNEYELQAEPRDARASKIRPRFATKHKKITSKQKISSIQTAI